jgi:hypothetical protein
VNTAITQQQVEDFLASLHRVPMSAAAFRALVALVIEADQHGNVYLNNHQGWLVWACALPERSVAKAVRQLRDAGRIAVVSPRHIRVLNVPTPR